MKDLFAALGLPARMLLFILFLIAASVGGFVIVRVFA